MSVKKIFRFKILNKIIIMKLYYILFFLLISVQSLNAQDYSNLNEIPVELDIHPELGCTELYTFNSDGCDRVMLFNKNEKALFRIGDNAELYNLTTGVIEKITRDIGYNIFHFNNNYIYFLDEKNNKSGYDVAKGRIKSAKKVETLDTIAKIFNNGKSLSSNFNTVLNSDNFLSINKDYIYFKIDTIVIRLDYGLEKKKNIIKRIRFTPARGNYQYAPIKIYRWNDDLYLKNYYKKYGSKVLELVRLLNLYPDFNSQYFYEITIRLDMVKWKYDDIIISSKYDYIKKNYDQKVYEAVEKENTLSAYETYIKHYKNGKNYNNAICNIKRLKGQICGENLEELLKENEYSGITLKSDLIKLIVESPELKQEKKIWDVAVKVLNTKDYLKYFPESDYAKRYYEILQQGKIKVETGGYFRAIKTIRDDVDLRENYSNQDKLLRMNYGTRTNFVNETLFWDGKIDENGFISGSGTLKIYQSNILISKFEGYMEDGMFKNGKFYSPSCEDCRYDNLADFRFLSRYSGPFKNNRAEGKGKFRNTLEDDDFYREYIGEWKDGLPHGLGMIKETVTLYVSKYEGDFKNGMADGIIANQIDLYVYKKNIFVEKIKIVEKKSDFEKNWEEKENALNKIKSDELVETNNIYKEYKITFNNNQSINIRYYFASKKWTHGANTVLSNKYNTKESAIKNIYLNALIYNWW